MVKVVKRMVEERRGRLGFVEEKQHRKRSRPVPVPSSGPAPLRRSTRLNPNRDAVEIRNDDSEKQMGIHPKNMHDEDFNSDSDSEEDCIPSGMMTAEDCIGYGINPDVHVVSKIDSLRLHICLYVPGSLTLLRCYRVSPILGKGCVVRLDHLQ
jgi:hypothetical protein